MPLQATLAKDGATIASVPDLQLPGEESQTADPTLQTPISDESDASGGSDFDLEHAMEARRRGLPGSYANFCKALQAARVGRF